jgi:hypothetical protein
VWVEGDACHSGPDREGCGVLDFVVVDVVMEMFVYLCGVDVEGGDRETGGEEQVFGAG